MKRRSLRHHYTRARRRYRVWEKRSRWRAIRTLPFAVAVILAFGIFENFGGGLRMATIFIPLCLGYVLITAGVHKGGRERRCKRCGYEQLWSPPAERDPDAYCPECGSLWYRPGATMRGQRTVRPGLLVAGITLVIMGLLPLPLSETVLGGGVYRLLSTDGIVSRAGGVQGISFEEWQVLRHRTLTSAQAERLARGILARRDGGVMLEHWEFDWFERMILQDALTSPLAERFFVEMDLISLDVPLRSAQGLPLIVQLNNDRYMKWLNVPVSVGGSYIERYIAFGGYRISEDGEVLARGEKLIDAFTFAWRAYSDDRNPGVVVRPAEVGPLPISAAVWFVALPRGVPPSLAWNEDGTPQLPPETIWAGVVELEEVVQIEP